MPNQNNAEQSISSQLEHTTRELAQIRDALNQSAIVAITDAAGTFTHINEKFCDISKYTREELIGQNHRILNSGHHSKEFFIQMWKTISSGKAWEGELKNKAKDGTYYWVNTSIIPFLDKNDKPVQYVSIRYEITQRKNAEEQLRVYADRLEVSNRELQDFASVAAHDLQEPLRKIQTFGDRMITKYQDVLPAEGKDYLERMLASAKRMRKLIDDLLTFSRVTTQAKPFETVNLNQLLKDVLSDLEIQIERVKGSVQVGDLPKIDADPSQMRQLFQNLISNALKFHKKDLSPLVSVQARAISRAWIEITVTDNGIGFEEKYLDRIFTIFQRLHGRTEYEGTGVGLAVCRRIVERHSGSITAKSALGEGAKFIITLPVSHS